MILLTRKEMAELLRISTRTLDQRRTLGLVLDPLQGAGQPRWSKEDVSAWLDAGRPTAETWRQMRSRKMQKVP